MAIPNTNNAVPEWACPQWGQYEHDWLDCPDCIAAYEAWLEACQKEEEESDDVPGML